MSIVTDYQMKENSYYAQRIIAVKKELKDKRQKKSHGINGTIILVFYHRVGLSLLLMICSKREHTAKESIMMTIKKQFLSIITAGLMLGGTSQIKAMNAALMFAAQMVTAITSHVGSASLD